MDASNIISLLGGVAMFLFGMSVMGDSLKNMQKYKRQKLLWEEKRSRLRALRVYFLFKKKLYRS